jgi:CheY-like chemotaxis protein
MVRTFDILNARVLIVDDQESHVLLLERMLRDAGYTSVESTMDPTEVCKLHRQNRYAAILLDLRMPIMDGFQVMEQLKEVEGDEDFPVLVITAEPGHKLRALRAGARDFVTKPLDLPEVLIRVHNMIEIRLLRMETNLLRAQLVDAQSLGIFHRIERYLHLILIEPPGLRVQFALRADVKFPCCLSVARKLLKITVLRNTVFNRNHPSQGVQSCHITPPISLPKSATPVGLCRLPQRNALRIGHASRPLTPTSPNGPMQSTRRAARADGYDMEDWTAASRELVAETFGHLGTLPSLSPSRHAQLVASRSCSAELGSPV